MPSVTGGPPSNDQLDAVALREDEHEARAREPDALAGRRLPARMVRDADQDGMSRRAALDRDALRAPSSRAAREAARARAPAPRPADRRSPPANSSRSSGVTLSGRANTGTTSSGPARLNQRYASPSSRVPTISIGARRERDRVAAVVVPDAIELVRRRSTASRSRPGSLRRRRLHRLRSARCTARRSSCAGGARRASRSRRRAAPVRERARRRRSRPPTAM